MSYCPLMMAANGLNLGDGPDAKSLNKSRECRADCAWRIGDDCAMVVLARAARVNACANCGATSKSHCEGCTNAQQEPRA